MAGVPPVKLSDGTEVYLNNRENCIKAYKDGAELTSAQKRLMDLHYPEQDRVEYDMKSGKAKQDAYKDGQDKINTEGVDNKNAAEATTASAATVGAGTAVAGTIFAICNGMKTLTKTTTTNGFTSIIGAALASAGAAVALAFSFRGTFDPDSGDRGARSDEAEGTNETISQCTTNLDETMGLMNEDMDLYKTQQDELTNNVNDNVSTKANLQAQLQKMAPDDPGRESVMSQIKGLEEVDFSQQEEEMTETRDHMEEYALCTEESQGISDAGRSVSNFLKVGNALAPVAYVNGALLAATVAVLLIAKIVGAIPKIAPFFPDTGPAISAGALWAVAAVLAGTASGMMFKNASFESECGENGNAMADKVNELDSMIENQTAYTETTEENYDASDEKAQEIKDQAKEAASKVTGEGPKTKVSVAGSAKSDGKAGSAGAKG